MITRSFLALLLITLGTAICVAQPLPEIVYDGGSRSHPFDVLHISLDVSFDFEREIVFGRVTHRFRSLSPDLTEIRLDAAPEINVSGMTVNGGTATFTHEGDDLKISLPHSLRYNDTASLEIIYSVSPKKGLYFIKKNPSDKEGRDQIWTQGEGEDHHYWIPMYDYPNDLVTSEVWGTVRSDWKLLSNGTLMEVRENAGGTTTWHYRMEKSHASYLMMLVAGDYLVTHDTALGVPLEYWSYPDMPERVKATFDRTPDVLYYFDSLIGVPYPWNKYAQIVIDRFMYGGMENTTATTLNDISLVDEKGILDYNPDGLIAHELAHQWFGDLVTNRSWDHLWLHESFATYLASRYVGYRYGEEEFQRDMFSYGEGAWQTDHDQGRSPISGGKGFTQNLYGRGAFVLHMLNRLVGEELFWRSIRLFLERNAHGLVETNDLKVAFEDGTGYNLNWFFEQWIYGTGMPDLRVRQEYDGDSLRLIIVQAQPRDSSTATFRFPVRLELLTLEGTMQENPIPGRRFEQVWLSDSVDTISVAVRSEPAAVVVDAGNHIMKRIEYAESPSGVLSRFLFAESVPDRVAALRKLSIIKAEEFDKDERLEPDPYAMMGKRFADLIEKESSPWIRQEMMEATAELKLPTSRDIIAAGLRDSVKEVREAAVENAWAIADTAERLRLVRPMLDDPSNEVVADALRTLAAGNAGDLEEPLQRMQFVEGRRQQIARAWMEAVAAGKFNQFADRVAWYALNSTRSQTRRTAFETLAALTETTPVVREAILSGLQDESSGTFKAALAAVKAHHDDEMKDLINNIRSEIPEERRKQIEEL